MSTPTGRAGGTGPTSASNPPVDSDHGGNPHHRSPLRRKVTKTAPSADHSVDHGDKGNPPPQRDTDVSNRKTTPSTGSTPTPQPKTEAEAQFEDAKKKLTGVMSKLWLRDQLDISMELASMTPAEADILANKLQIVIKIRMPNSTKVVQLIPTLAGEGGVGEDHVGDGYAFLKGGCDNLSTRLRQETSVQDLHDQYVVYRNQVFEHGQEVYNAKGELFDYEQHYIQMVISAFSHKTESSGISFTFSRGAPDRSKYKDPGDLSTPSLKKTKKKSPKNKEPQLELRINADEEDILKHAKRLHRTESSASANDDNESNHD
ncbi:hypothetical protein [Parendozoicomonas sp. Alg238-R29]|uniref:hypothetical protein n=1 Tax=Parendozoicomonas sp. Alg238-R29 TaxID=2993446 RepID=UPI00248E8D31|nr:hypothetical protein [Parendozoicomonas sp. Alg238-R29]